MGTRPFSYEELKTFAIHHKLDIFKLCNIAQEVQPLVILWYDPESDRIILANLDGTTVRYISRRELI